MTVLELIKVTSIVYEQYVIVSGQGSAEYRSLKIKQF